MDLNNLKDLKVKIASDADPKILAFYEKLGSALVLIYKAVNRPIVLPKIFQIRGEVEVTRPISIQNFSDLEKYFKSLENKFSVLAQAASTAPAPIINVPKIEIPKMSKADNSKVESLLENLINKIDKIKPTTEVKFPKNISVDNFPITHTPQPVTNISINALQGLAKTSSDTVGTTLTPLPSYGRLFNRRSLQIYNNSGSTIYIGGSDVTTTNGFPVSAGNYSPTIDAGYNMIIYGIAGSEGLNVRVIEVATKSEGGVAIQS